VAELVVEPQHREAPCVLHGRIERDAVLLARQHLAKTAEADDRRIVFAYARLERLPVTRDVVRHARELGAAAAALKMVAADEVGMTIGDVPEPRNVRRHRTPIVERRFGSDPRRDISAAADAHDVLAQIATEHSRRTPET